MCIVSVLLAHSSWCHRLALIPMNSAKILQHLIKLKLNANIWTYKVSSSNSRIICENQLTNSKFLMSLTCACSQLQKANVLNTFQFFSECQRSYDRFSSHSCQSFVWAPLVYLCVYSASNIKQMEVKIHCVVTEVGSLFGGKKIQVQLLFYLQDSYAIINIW